ncbi:hypothetical protein TBLA_0G02150 [Henningerozyma blattae CBS 6284]|uniref:Damage-regulated import facilitator 1 n=1 Tax=Henningerozyma blattae (strain ATCC 34711 / CBS 6284 / DSM 70876 / NBRC 10599 / NRRL Y-10934 / UCD 77-7) TaxID=1071380 RepID=I2H704_HENB6|nr:hypothetical protein TBLA_0G02150 [Tetrapisispora blattae CBS 6284]CCH62156.1 hypothetical protein TBLA_0G02150 [Tetrapisispora blattae CBS 6284]
MDTYNSNSLAQQSADGENMKQSRISPSIPSSAQFRSKHHDEVMSAGMRVRQSINASYLSNLNNYTSKIVPGYKREELPNNLKNNPPMISMKQRTTSSFSNSNLETWDLSTVSSKEQQTPNNAMTSFDEDSKPKRRRDEDEDEDDEDMY